MARYSAILDSSIPRAFSTSVLNSGRVDPAFPRSTWTSRSGRSFSGPCDGWDSVEQDGLSPG
eukprot:4091194-Lingulodinium_polyedra.AAC.1